MLIYLATRIISATGAFLYPGYASYKTLSQRPASEAELERWLMYWSVLGCIVSVEYVAEWLVSWIPFYYFWKMLFLLYLALPQTRGSSYLYINHLQPFFREHEQEIDATLASFKFKIYTYLQERIRMLWEHIASTLSQSSSSNQPPTGGPTSAQPPTLADPVSGPAQLVGNLWRTYGPSIVAGGAALLHQSGQNQAANQAPLSDFFGAGFAPSPPRQDSSQSAQQLNRQIEANHTGGLESTAQTIPAQHGSSSYSPNTPSRTSSETDLRSRGGAFEEVDVPSDAEGYTVADEAHVRAAARRTSWFGWATGSGDGRGGYERVKND